MSAVAPIQMPPLCHQCTPWCLQAAVPLAQAWWEDSISCHWFIWFTKALSLGRVQEESVFSLWKPQKLKNAILSFLYHWFIHLLINMYVLSLMCKAFLGIQRWKKIYNFWPQGSLSLARWHIYNSTTIWLWAEHRGRTPYHEVEKVTHEIKIQRQFSQFKE